jgi:hypothetical protein
MNAQLTSIGMLSASAESHPLSYFFFCRFADIPNSLEGPELAYMY